MMPWWYYLVAVLALCTLICYVWLDREYEREKRRQERLWELLHRDEPFDWIDDATIARDEKLIEQMFQRGRWN